MLRDGPHCVCEIAARSGARENNVSNHLAKLRDAGLVRASRHGGDARFLYYERDEDAIAAARPRSQTSCDDHAPAPRAPRSRCGSRSPARASPLAHRLVPRAARCRLAHHRRPRPRPAAGFGQAVAFFLFDLPKVLLLLSGIVTAVSFLRSFVSPERVRRHARRAQRRRRDASRPPASASSRPSAPARRCRCSSASSRRACRWASRSPSWSPRPWSTRWRSCCCGACSGPRIAIAYLVAGLVVAIGAGLARRRACASSATSSPTSRRSTPGARPIEITPHDGGARP